LVPNRSPHSCSPSVRGSPETFRGCPRFAPVVAAEVRRRIFRQTKFRLLTSAATAFSEGEGNGLAALSGPQRRRCGRNALAHEFPQLCQFAGSDAADVHKLGDSDVVLKILQFPDGELIARYPD